MSFAATHVVRRHDFTVARPMRAAVELFTPQGERAWAPGWDPTWLWPPDGATQVGMVFTTDHGGEHTIWTMTLYHPTGGRVEYVRTTPGSRLGVVRVECVPIDAGSTSVRVTYSITALTEAGNAMLADLDEAAFAGFIDSWKEAIARL